MVATKKSFWKSYLNGLQLHVAIADYTKVPLNWNEDNYTPNINKLYFIEEGEGYINLGDKRFYPKPGNLCLLPAEKRQSYGTISEQTFGKYWCHFTAKLGGLHLFHMLETPVVIPIKAPAVIRERFDRLVAAHKSEDWTAGMHEQAALLEILALFIEQAGTVSFNPKSAGAIDKMSDVLAYIEDHLSENLSVDQLAALVHFHPNYFIRVFKHTTGLSPIQYVNRKRIDKARHLLTFTEMNVSAIADALGLEPTYFSRLFKEYTGLSPSQYKAFS